MIRGRETPLLIPPKMSPVTINQFTQPITLDPSTVDLLKQCLCMDVYIQGRGRTSSRLASDIFVSTGCTGVVPRRAIARNRSLVVISSVTMDCYFCITKKSPDQFDLGFLIRAWRWPTLTWGNPTLPSAILRFTTEFGMGSGGSTALWSSDKLVLRGSGLI